MSIVLIRHGETDLNAARVLQWPDTPLGERGRAQARALGVRFAAASPRPVLLASSDMARAPASRRRRQKSPRRSVSAARSRPWGISIR